MYLKHKLLYLNRYKSRVIHLVPVHKLLKDRNFSAVAAAQLLLNLKHINQ